MIELGKEACEAGQEDALAGDELCLGILRLEPRDPVDLRERLDAARATFAIIRDALDTETVAARLECDPQQDAFRRMVH